MPLTISEVISLRPCDPNSNLIEWVLDTLKSPNSKVLIYGTKVVLLSDIYNPGTFGIYDTREEAERVATILTLSISA